MPVQTQTLSIALSKGLDTKTDPKQIVPATLTTLQNAIFTTPERLSKRNGYVPLPPLTYGVACSPFQNELVELDSLNIWSWSEAESSWFSKGIKQTCSIYQQNIFTPEGTPVAPNVALTPTTSLYTWQNTPLGTPPIGASLSNIEYSLIDNITQEPIVSSVRAVSGSFSNFPGPITMPIAIGNNYDVLYLDGFDNTLDYFSVTSSTGAPGSPTLLISSVSAAAENLDICQNLATTTSYVVYGNLSGTLSISSLNTSTTTLSVTNTITTAIPNGNFTNLVYDSTNNYIWLFCTDGSAHAQYTIYDSTLTLVLAPTVIDSANSGVFAGSGIVIGGVGTLFYSYFNPPPANISYQNTTNSAICTVGGVVSPSLLLPSSTVASKTFLVTPAAGSTSYIQFVVSYASPLQAVAFIIRYISPGVYQVVAKIAPGQYFQSVLQEQPFVPSLSSQVFVLPYLQPIASSEITANAPINYLISGSIFNFNTKPQRVSLANTLNYTGGFLSSYDGTTNFEQNFFLFPESSVATLASGTALSIGTYSYEFTYEWFDANGQLQRSAPSAPLEITTTSGNQEVSLQIPILYMTNKILNNQSQVNIVVYRTLVNQTVYLKAAVLPNRPATPGAIFITFVDTTTDVQLQENVQLYTTGGEVPNSSPPASDLVCSYDNRVILVPSEQPLQWWYSKQVINEFPIEFSQVFVNNIDQRGGNITAVAAMDAEIIFFKENVIFYVTGQGPAPNGSSNDFTYPQIITTDVGCINPESVILTPAGLMFKSSKGIYLLDRSLSTSYIGAPVESFNNISINSAQLTQGTTQVRFTLADGTALVYDYFVNQWSEFTNINAIDSCIYGETYTTLSVAGLVQKETPGVFTDNGAPISMSFTLGKILTAQVQGFERAKQLMILGQALSPTNLSISFNYDYSIIPNQTTMIPVTAPAMPMQYRIFLNQQKCEDLQITISDSPQIPYGEGINLSNLALEVGVKKGPYKVPAAITYA